MNLGLRRFLQNNPAPSPKDLAGKSRIFLDSGKTEDYVKFLPLGIIYGITTNPTILERSGVPCTIAAIKDLALSAFSLGAQEFMAQTWGGDDVDILVKHGIEIASLDPRMVIKVPVTAAGLKAATLLRRQDVRICTTAIYASHQAVSSVAVGAEYAAPYLGRMKDSGKDGIAQVRAMQRIVEGMSSVTRVLVASVRTADEVGELAAMGCTTFTLSAEVVEAMTAEPQTLEAAETFEKAAGTQKVTPKTPMGLF